MGAQEQFMAQGQEVPMGAEQPVEQEPSEEEQIEFNNIQALMEEFGVPQEIAVTMREAELNGVPKEKIFSDLQTLLEAQGASNE